MRFFNRILIVLVIICFANGSYSLNISSYGETSKKTYNLTSQFDAKKDSNWLAYPFKRNAVQISIFVPGLYYQYLFKNISKKRTVVPFAKIGSTLDPGSDWDVFSSLQGGMITGSKASHFEASIGVLYWLNWGEILPAFSIGYRYQKPGKNRFFRTGIGLSELIYIGGGFSF